MKDLMRLRTSLKEELELALNAQVKMEAESSSKYLAMAAWCDRNGFSNKRVPVFWVFFKNSFEKKTRVSASYHSFGGFSPPLR